MRRWWPEHSRRSWRRSKAIFETGEGGTPAVPVRLARRSEAERCSGGVAMPGMLSFLVYRDFDTARAGPGSAGGRLRQPARLAVVSDLSPDGRLGHAVHRQHVAGRLVVAGAARCSRSAGCCGTSCSPWAWRLWPTRLGWVAAEVGRQPWIVYPTVDAAGDADRRTCAPSDAVSEVVTSELGARFDHHVRTHLCPAVCAVGVPAGSGDSAGPDDVAASRRAA